MFADDTDAEVFVVCMFDDDVDFNLVDLDHVPIQLLMDHTLLGHIPVRQADGSVDLRYGRVLAAGSKLTIKNSILTGSLCLLNSYFLANEKEMEKIAWAEIDQLLKAIL